MCVCVRGAWVGWPGSGHASYGSARTKYCSVATGLHSTLPATRTVRHRDVSLSKRRKRKRSTRFIKGASADHSPSHHPVSVGKLYSLRPPLILSFYEHFNRRCFTAAHVRSELFLLPRCSVTASNLLALQRRGCNHRTTEDKRPRPRRGGWGDGRVPNSFDSRRNQIFVPSHPVKLGVSPPVLYGIVV